MFMFYQLYGIMKGSLIPENQLLCVHFNGRIDPLDCRVTSIPSISVEVRIIMKYLCFVMFTFKCQRLFSKLVRINFECMIRKMRLWVKMSCFLWLAQRFKHGPQMTWNFCENVTKTPFKTWRLEKEKRALARDGYSVRFLSSSGSVKENSDDRQGSIWASQKSRSRFELAAMTGYVLQLRVLMSQGKH